MPLPNKTELNQIFDDYVFVRTNGKWNTVSAIIEGGLRKASKYATHAINFLTSFLSTSNKPAADVKTDPHYNDKDTPTIKQEICGEFKTKFTCADTVDQWITICMELGEEARKQALDERNESLLVKALCAARSFIQRSLRSNENSEEFKTLKSKIDILNKQRDDILKLIMATELHGHNTEENEKEHRSLLSKLSDLGDDNAIIAATKAGIFKYFIPVPKSAAPHLKFDPSMPTVALVNIHKPIIYQDNYFEVYQKEIRYKKSKIEALQVDMKEINSADKGLNSSNKPSPMDSKATPTISINPFSPSNIPIGQPSSKEGDSVSVKKDDDKAMPVSAPPASNGSGTTAVIASALNKQSDAKNQVNATTNTQTVVKPEVKAKDQLSLATQTVATVDQEDDDEEDDIEVQQSRAATRNTQAQRRGRK